MRRRRLTEFDSKPVAVDISPLLDVVFILLIFFIVTAVFVEETGVEVQRPSSISQTDLPNKSALIALTANGEVWHGGSRIGLAGIAPLLAQTAADARNIIIQADTVTPTGKLVALIDACKLAGASSVNVATKPSVSY